MFLSQPAPCIHPPAFCLPYRFAFRCRRPGTACALSWLGEAGVSGDVGELAPLTRLNAL